MINPLRESGKPLFFRVANPASPDLVLPPVHDQSLRVAVRSLTVMQKEALVYNSATATCWRLASDEGAYLAGLDEAPCPLAFFTTGLVAFYCEEIQMLAKRRGLAIRPLKLVMDNYYTMKGSALRGTMTGGARDVELEVWIESEASAESLSALVTDAVAASPVAGLLQAAMKSYFSLTHDGNPLPLPDEIALANVLPDPLPLFDSARPELDAPNLIVRNGMSPETEETVTRAGGSLQAEQDRVLHIRGICTLRDDGIKAIEQQLFNPHGSIFHFLCEEGAQSGGMGRAPDAASYLSAGIGFCFMTQLGRYAHITKKDLRQYRILQDTHFPRSGSNSTVNAVPVETHVYLESAEPEDFARKALQMGEQTCFLHAFCRTALNTIVKVNAA